MASPDIHPSAIIDSGACLGDDVTVGPYCIIGEGVELGDGCLLHSHVVLAGPAIIGKQNEFYPHCVIGGRSQDLKYEGEPTYLRVGEGNTFREFVTVNRGTSPGEATIIGNNELQLKRFLILVGEKSSSLNGSTILSPPVINFVQNLSKNVLPFLVLP